MSCVTKPIKMSQNFRLENILLMFKFAADHLANSFADSTNLSVFLTYILYKTRIFFNIFQ